MKKRILSLILSLTLLTGCSASTEENGIVLTGESLLQNTEVTWEMNYEVPTGNVNVLVDRSGYFPDREKEVCFRGEKLGKTFDLINADTKEVVYTGEITDQVYDDASGEYVSHGDFSEVTKEGTYYIETDVIGRSYQFQIGKQVYDDMIRNMENMFTNVSCMYDETASGGENTNCPYHEQESAYSIDSKQIRDISGGWHTDASGSKDVTDGCMTMTAMAMAITYYADVLQSEEPTNEQEKHSMISDMLYEADWLLRMQENSGGVYAGVVVDETANKVTLQPVSYQATASYAGAMAICSQLLQNYDSNASKTCASSAKKAWGYLVKQNCEDPSARFYAAGWLYRLTGEKNYLQIINEFMEQENEPILKNRFALFGKVAYISTERKMDTEVCASIMGEIMDAAENTASVSHKDVYYLYSHDMQVSMERLLIISIANYVTPSNEYVKVLRNYVHYLLGRNAGGYQYMNDDGSLVSNQDTTQGTLEWRPILLMTMCGIVDAER